MVGEEEEEEEGEGLVNKKNWGPGFIFIIMKAGAEERETG